MTSKDAAGELAALRDPTDSVRLASAAAGTCAAQQHIWASGRAPRISACVPAGPGPQLERGMCQRGHHVWQRWWLAGSWHGCCGAAGGRRPRRHAPIRGSRASTASQASQHLQLSLSSGRSAACLLPRPGPSRSKQRGSPRLRAPCGATAARGRRADLPPPPCLCCCRCPQRSTASPAPWTRTWLRPCSSC